MAPPTSSQKQRLGHGFSTILRTPANGSAHAISFSGPRAEHTLDEENRARGVGLTLLPSARSITVKSGLASRVASAPGARVVRTILNFRALTQPGSPISSDFDPAFWSYNR